MAASRRRWPGQAAGFGLLEMMIVVAIVGVLAVVAIPLFSAYQLRSKSAEARTNLGVLRALEHTYQSEHDQFFAAVPEPPLIPGSSPTVFNAGGSFAELGFRPEGRVFFSYGVAVTADGAGYTIDAGADIDADGFPQFWGFALPDGTGSIGAGQVGCNVAELIGEQIGPCGSGHGTSVF